MLQTTKTILCTIEENFVLNKLSGGAPVSLEKMEKLNNYITAYRSVLDKFFPDGESVFVSEDILYNIFTEFYYNVGFDEVLGLLPDIEIPLSEVTSDIDSYIRNVNILTDEEKDDLINDILTDIKTLGKERITAKEYIGIYITKTSRHPSFIRSTAKITMSDVLAYISLGDHIVDVSGR